MCMRVCMSMFVGKCRNVSGENELRFKLEEREGVGTDRQVCVRARG